MPCLHITRHTSLATVFLFLRGYAYEKVFTALWICTTAVYLYPRTHIEQAKIQGTEKRINPPCWLKLINVICRTHPSYEKGELVQWHIQYGYNITKDKIEINPEQAEVVRNIFDRAIAGETFGSICRDLNTRGISTYFGKKWTARRITEILSNEKYIGDAVLQKSYVNNHMEKKIVKNNGEIPMYYAEGTHEAIVDKETFEKAQSVVKAVREKYCGKNSPKRYPFTSTIKCGLCGENFKRVTANGRISWNCRSFQEQGRAFCKSKSIPETTLISVTAEVLGLDSFDEKIFYEKIDHIKVPGANSLIFYFKDGRSVERKWKDRSRSESWTPEMREAARQRAIKQRRDK